MSRIPRQTTAGRVFNDLRNKARREGRTTEELLVLYALERWLYRLSLSPHADSILLKGGLLLSVLDARRPTRDGDLLLPSMQEEADLLARVSDIASISADDGIVFDVEQARSTTIREEERYAGLRVVVPATLASARLKLALDVNIGDPVTPGPVRITYPTLLPTANFELLAYPVETVLAEKIVTALSRGEANTRDRDWADLWRLTGVHAISGAVLADALRRTAQYRQVRLQPLAPRIGALADLRATPYRRWRHQQGADGGAYPPEFADVVRQVLSFADPALDGAVGDLAWDPQRRRWHRT